MPPFDSVVAPQGLRGPARESCPAAQPESAGVYFEHLRDLAARPSLVGIDASRIDAMIAVRLRATGHSREEVAEVIELGAAATRPTAMVGDQAWREYGRRAAVFAFGPAGNRQLEATRGYHGDWRALGARWARSVSGTQEPQRRGRGLDPPII